ncbi:MAG: WecB/TagA/CpsF family glycosyltransferase [Burkholderiales bacterium]|nr:WecB/TagA/CpsF family glycosyltransferase [Burkholderiales bacterium]
MNDFDRNIYCLLGLPFDAVDMAGAVRRVREAAGRRTPCFLSTPNLNFLIACQTDAEFRDSVINSNLNIADGMPLVWIARLLGIPIRERVAGSDLFEQLRKGTSAQLSVYFFGGMEGVAKEACRRLNAKSSGLVCAGHETPGFGSIEDMSGDESIGKINASGADFLVVSLGAKKGQAWIEHNRARISVPVISHLGAVVNFVAGTVSRAPRWMQQVGLEWVWRIMEERGLWRRYFNDLLALLRLLATRVIPYALFLRCQPVSQSELAAATVEIREREDACVIYCQGAWSAQNIDRLRSSFKQAAARSCDIELNLEQVTYVDSAFIGLVMLLYKHQQKLGKRLVITGLSKRIEKIFRWNGAAFLYGMPAPIDESDA